jgi:BMFP domain-containing protein YqiC
MLQDKFEVDLADLEFATSLVATKVGDRPATLGTDSLFKLVEDVVDDIGKLNKTVATLENPELAAARDLQLGVKIGQDIIGHLNPVFRLFASLSRSKEAPGDILEERLHALESRSTHASSFGPVPGTTAAPIWHAGTRPQAQNLQVSPSEEALTARVQFLEAQLKDMQDEMTAQSVQIGTINFVSRTMVQAWMDQTRCPPRTCIFFLDAMSVLALMHGGYDSAQSAAEFASITKKVGYETTEEALVVTSFNLELPEAFGSLPKTGVAKDSRVLPGLPTFKEWDGGDGYLGLKVELANKLGEFMIPMGQHYRQCLSGEALIVAMEMIASSKLFISDLSTWINTTYQDTRARTMALEKEAWSLISHCVRVIFKLLRDARSSGARWMAETRDAQMVWAQFQCHRLMEELRLAQFSAHPALSHVLNLHLQDNVVSRSRYETLEKKVAELGKIANDAKKTADKALAAKK